MFCLLRGANVNVKTIHLKLFKSPLHNSTYNTNVTNLFRPNQTRGNLLFKGGNRTSQSSNKDSFLTTTLSLFVRRQRTNVAQSGKKAAETVKAQKLDKNGLMRLIKLAKPEKYKLAVAMVLLIISSSVTMAVPFFIGKLIDFIQTGDTETMKEKLQYISLVLTGIFIIGAVANFGRVYLIQSTGQRIVARLRQRLFRATMNQEMAFFDRNKTGELINRLSTDAEVVGNSISQNLSDGMRASIQAGAGVGMMLYVSPMLAGIGLSIIPAITVFAVVFGRYIKKLSKQVQDVLAQATDVAEERLSNIRTVRAFAQEEKEASAYERSVTNVLNMKFKEAMAYGIFYGFTGLSGNIIIISVFYFGGGYISDQVITIGDLSAFLLYSAWVGVSIAGLSTFYTELMRGIGASQRTWEIIDRHPSIPILTEKAGGHLLTPEVLKGDISFENVTFAYPTRSEQKILKNMNLVIPGGKVCAVVGPSGSGKSTLAALLLRFYDPQEGSIKIGGRDIRTVVQKNLRDNIGSVPQEPTLFSTTIRDNIAYSFENPQEVTIEQIYEAAQQANAFSFIEQFPEKFNTVLGERGLSLSGGQKQRVAIARAILKDPQILLLDEATSALDAASEYLVQEALERIMENRTVIIIAHRLSTIKNADLIAVLDKGHVVELGSYDSLMQNDAGKFKELVARQTIDVDYTVTN